jgi:hypothetical protein
MYQLELLSFSLRNHFPHLKSPTTTKNIISYAIKHRHAGPHTHTGYGNKFFTHRSKDHLEIRQGQQLPLSQQHHELEECQSIPSLPAATVLAPPISHYVNTKAFFCITFQQHQQKCSHLIYRANMRI